MNLLAGLGASVIGISVSTAAPGPGPSGHNTLASLVTARVQAKAGAGHENPHQECQAF